MSSHGHLGRPSLPWPAIAAGLVLSELVVIDVTSSEASMSIMLTGLPAALALAYLSPMGLLGAFSIEAIAYSVRFGKSWYKTAFNIANALTSASVAYLVVGAIRGSGSSVSAVGILGIGAGLAALQMTGTIGILIANGVSSGKIHWSHVRASYLESLVTLALDIPLGILAVILAYRQAWTLLLLAGPVVLIAFWNRTVKTIRKRYSNLQLMYDFSVKLAGVPDTDSIIRTALDETRVLFACQQSQLVLPLGTGAYRYELSGEGTRVHELGFLSTIEEEVVSNGRPALVSKTDTGEEPHEFEDLMAVVVPLGDIGNGVLVAGNHNSDSESFDTEDLRLFETLAAHLSTALTSSRRLDQLRSEMAAREHQALHDSLTGLANRTMFAQRVCIALEHHRIEELVAVMLMDLDGFKDINDSLGHPAGDTLLKEVAARIETEFGPNGTVARLGGDEFAFVFPSLGSGTEAKALARSVLDAVSKPISLDGMLLELRGSMGLALAPHHGTEASVLLQKADVAMYEAKDSKRGVVAYNSDMDRSAKRRLTLASGLRRAFESGQLEVWYQPVARADTGRVAGCEALLRWRTDIEFVPPSEFIPVAEQTGLIEPLTWWVLESSLRQLGRWQSEDLGQTVAVNLSARCLQSSDVVARVNELLRRTGVTAESLILEVTESLIMSDPEASRVILGDLAELGVRIAVDDFGTGHSSMSRLKRMPVHSLKIDREFVMNMHIDRSDEAIVRACIELARALGHTVTAEGVENFETWEQLRRLGCNDIQGYLLAAAMPPEECLDWMRARRQLDFGPDFALLRKVVGGA
ncbi:MAG: EAL domain-containing protein [Acidimicrobiales bacterium]|nr:EAL domain-containing protein [Acidimicrobiales bacterium]